MFLHLDEGFPVGRTHRHWEHKRICKAPRVEVNVHLSLDSETTEMREKFKSEKLGLVPTRLIVYSLGLPCCRPESF